MTNCMPLCLVYTPWVKDVLMRNYIIQTLILTLISLSVTSCRISEPTPEPERDIPLEQETQDARDDHAGPDTSVAESAGIASSDMIDSGVEDAMNCDGSSCDLQCEVDEECQHLEHSGITFYCDLGERRCKEGCYEGQCFGDLVCNLETRVCNNSSCISNADCSENQRCDLIDLICRTVTPCGDRRSCDVWEECDPVSGRCIDPVILDRTTGINWVYVPAGTFQMGSEDDESEQPVHQVTVQSFRISETEVTVGQYRRCVEAGRCREPRTFGWCTWTEVPREMERLPVNCITWDEARTFAKWAGGDLPTEAQWEYAARGGALNEYAGSDDIDEVSWWSGNTDLSIQPVRTKRANGYGLYDMSGNLLEWALDRWHINYVGAPSQAEIQWGPIPECDPICAVLEGEVVIRGGSFTAPEYSHRVTKRGRINASTAGDNYGIRVRIPLF